MKHYQPTRPSELLVMLLIAGPLLSHQSFARTASENPSPAAKSNQDKPPASKRYDVTFVQLLDEMIDLDRLADHPGATYTCKMASSYDRKSTDPAEDTLENWQANRDFVSKEDLAQFVRIDERNGEKEYVLMDVTGPGAIVRIWSAVAERAGNLRIYIDGAAEPTIDMPMQDLLVGKDRPRIYVDPSKAKSPKVSPGPKTMQFPHPICRQVALGWNCNLPIPYAKSCKVVTTEADETYWYQVTYRDYAFGTHVEPFSLELARAHKTKINDIAAKLANPVDLIKPLMDASLNSGPREKTQTIKPGEFYELGVDGREWALYRITCKLEAEDLPKALRGCLLEIWCDRDEDPKVQVPVGDFFATAPGINPYRSLPMAVEPDGTMICNWVMPFHRTIMAHVTNHTDQPVKVWMKVLVAPRPWTMNTMYFNAAWRSTPHLRSMPRRDWNFLTITGQGRYLGNMLHVANGQKHWWGEGDEKIFVDNEPFPSIFGTGTEDYYGYACCSRELFTHAYHNQNRCEGPGNSGHTCLSRFHILDDLPFLDKLQFDMEIWHWEDGDISYAATSWWYAKEGDRNNRAPIQPRQMTVPELPPPDQRPGHSLFGD